MKTPKDYNENLALKRLSLKMLLDSVYSMNKRAKNCRDRYHYYNSLRYSFDHKVDYIISYKNKMREYYNIKESLLSIVTPTCGHRIEKEDGETLYFKFYSFNDYPYTFHIPCSELEYYNTTYFDPFEEEEDEDYYEDTYYDTDIEIDELNTNGKDINELISVQFVKKVLDLISSEDFTATEDLMIYLFKDE